MHVVLLVRWPVGGIRTYVRDLVLSDAFQDVRFDIVLPRHAEAEMLAAECSGREVGWRFFAEDTTTGLVKGLAGLGLKKRYALLHSHGFTAASIAAWPMVLSGTPHLTTAHEVLTPAQFAGASGFARKCLLSATLPCVGAIHTVTQEARDNLLQYIPVLRPRAHRLHVITHGIRVERFLQAEVRDLHAELGYSRDTKLIGFLGRFMEAKGFSVLIDAVARLAGRTASLPPFKVLAAGYGGFIREDRARIEKLGLTPHFHFLDFVRDTGPTLKGMDLVVMPSLWEASGLLAMETVVCGTPLVASRCIGLRETLSGTPALLVEPANPEALADAIAARLLEDGKAQAKAYVPTAVQRYDSHQSFASLRHLYNETASGA